MQSKAQELLSQREVRVHYFASRNAPNSVAQVIDIFENMVFYPDSPPQKALLMVLEFCSSGDLFGFMRACSWSVDEVTARFVCAFFFSFFYFLYFLSFFFFFFLNILFFYNNNNRSLFYSIALGVADLHRLGVCHRDIKPEVCFF